MKAKYLFNYYLKEICKTNKIYILLITFLIIGLYPPVEKYYEPIIIKQLASQYESLLHTSAINFKESYYELFDVFNQIGVLLAMCFTFTEVSNDRKSGNMSVFFINGLSRFKYIITLFLNRAIIFMGCYFIAYLCCMGYCQILFHQSIVPVTFSMLLLSIGYLFVYISISVLMTMFINSTLAQFITIFVIYLMGKVIAAIPILKVISYGAIMEKMQLLLNNQIMVQEVVPFYLLYLILCCMNLAITSFIFRKKEIW